MTAQPKTSRILRLPANYRCIFKPKSRIAGFRFKEDCPDLRNSKVIDIIRELQDYGINVQVCDPLADPAEALHEYGVSLVSFTELQKADAAILAVAHHDYRNLSVDALCGLMNGSPLLIDVKGIFNRDACQAAGIRNWRL